MTDIVERLREGLHDLDIQTMLNPLLDEAADEIERLRKSESDLRKCLERVLLDVKFMVEDSIIPNDVTNDYIYHSALSLMTEDFMKKFNND